MEVNAEWTDVKKDISLVQNNIVSNKYNSITSAYQAALRIVDDVVLKNYVGKLSYMPIVPLSKDIIEKNGRAVFVLSKEME